VLFKRNSAPPPGEDYTNHPLSSRHNQRDQLTQEQRIVLDVLHDSERVLVDGGAAKTLLAIADRTWCHHSVR
jgi:hypothetical protein